MKKVFVQVFKHCNLLLQYKLITEFTFCIYSSRRAGNLISPVAVNISEQLVDFVVIQRDCSKSETKLEKDTTQHAFHETIRDVLGDECYPDEIKIELKTFIPHENQTTILFEEIKSIYEKSCKSLNVEQFFVSFYSNIVKYSEKVYSITPPIVCYCGNKISRKTFSALEGNKMRLYLMIQPAFSKLLKEKWQVFRVLSRICCYILDKKK